MTNLSTKQEQRDPAVARALRGKSRGRRSRRGFDAEGDIQSFVWPINDNSSVQWGGIDGGKAAYLIPVSLGVAHGNSAVAMMTPCSNNRVSPMRDVVISDPDAGHVI